MIQQQVWDLTGPSANTRIPHKPSYTLHPSFPVRRVLWRPSFDCELAIVSNAEFGTVPSSDVVQNISLGPGAGPPGTLTRVGSGFNLDMLLKGVSGIGRQLPEGGRHSAPTGTPDGKSTSSSSVANLGGGDAIEIWDVRRGWIAKWSVAGSAAEGGVTGNSNQSILTLAFH